MGASDMEKPDTRSDVGVIGRNVRMSVNTVQVCDLECGGYVCRGGRKRLQEVKVRDPAVRFGEGGEDVVADAIEQRQPRVDLPAILHETVRLVAAVVGRVQVEVARIVLEGAHQG